MYDNILRLILYNAQIDEKHRKFVWGLEEVTYGKK